MFNRTPLCVGIMVLVCSSFNGTLAGMGGRNKEMGMGMSISESESTSGNPPSSSPTEIPTGALTPGSTTATSSAAILTGPLHALSDPVPETYGSYPFDHDISNTRVQEKLCGTDLHIQLLTGNC